MEPRADLNRVGLDLSSGEALFAGNRLVYGQIGRIATGARSWRWAADITSASSARGHSAGMQQHFAFIGDVRGNDRITDGALEMVGGTQPIAGDGEWRWISN